MHKKIENINDLRNLSKDKFIACFILLNGNLRSSKNIRFRTGQKRPWCIDNEIDGSHQDLSEKEFEQSFIAEAIRKGAFYQYNL